MQAMRFWHDPALPFIEAQRVLDGGTLCYGRHSHATFSIGAVTGGRSRYWHQAGEDEVGRGDVVIMNPEDMHACNPDGNTSWAYWMFYIDAAWLADLQHQLGAPHHLDFQMYADRLCHDPRLYRRLLALGELLIDTRTDALARESALTTLCISMHERLVPETAPPEEDPRRLKLAADYIRAHCREPIGLDDICQAAGLSRSYLVRRFKRAYGLTPHAFLINQRIQFGREQLRHGQPIADVAMDCGFADQAHFQRTFKRLLATTPGQYLGQH